MERLGVVLVFSFLILGIVLSSPSVFAGSHDNVFNESNLKVEFKGFLFEVTTSDGKKHNITFLPDQASDAVKSRLNTTNVFDISLEEIIHNNIPRVVYKVQTRHEGRFLGVFKLQLKVETIIDSETEEILDVNVPWWTFLLRRLEIPDDLPKNNDVRKSGNGNGNGGSSGNGGILNGIFGNGNEDSGNGNNDTGSSSGSSGGGGGGSGGGGGGGSSGGGNETSPYCTDSDGGLNYLTKGFVDSLANASFWHDSCQDSNTLLETYCIAVVPNVKEESCQYGCSDGACLEAPYCTDSDGGLNYLTKGFVDSLANASFWHDSCQDSNTLLETYCIAVVPNVKEESCQYGCSDGACLEAPYCTDSDGGLNYLTNGYVNNSINESLWYDSCQDSNTLLETYCISESPSSTLESCQNGCSNGVCALFRLVTLTNSASSTIEPDLYENTTVWKNYNGTYNIFLCDFTGASLEVDSEWCSTLVENGGGLKYITNDANEQEWARIDGDKIVWHDDRNGNLDIYMYNLTANQEVQITSDTSEQSYAQIHGDKIVWLDYRNGNSDIYMYDITTSQETQITSDSARQNWVSLYGDKIVWEDDRNGNDDIYMYDLSTSQETQITTNNADQRGPDIYGDVIVWRDKRHSINSDIYMYNLSDSQETRLTSGVMLRGIPYIYGDKIAYQAWDYANRSQWDIYIYNLTSSQEILAGDHGSNDGMGNIYGDKVIWRADLTGNQLALITIS